MRPWEEHLHADMARYVEQNKKLDSVTVTGYDYEDELYGCPTCGPDPAIIKIYYKVAGKGVERKATYYHSLGDFLELLRNQAES